jgi:hypothetical protein
LGLFSIFISPTVATPGGDRAMVRAKEPKSLTDLGGNVREALWRAKRTDGDRCGLREDL